MQKFQPRLSPKEIATYQALATLNRKSSAQEIAQELNSPIQHVYRYLWQLEQLGLVNRYVGRPAIFEVVSPLSALENFLTFQEVWFCQMFPNDINQASRSTEPIISFFRKRNDLITASAIDMTNAQYSVDLITSGHEIPAEIVQAQRQAIKFGVKVRFLVQEHYHTDHQIFKNWVKLGINVRLSEKLHTKLYLYDDTTTYLVTLSDEPLQTMGVKIISVPMNQFLRQLFEQYWHQGIDVK